MKINTQYLKIGILLGVLIAVVLFAILRPTKQSAPEVAVVHDDTASTSPQMNFQPDPTTFQPEQQMLAQALAAAAGSKAVFKPTATSTTDHPSSAHTNVGAYAYASGVCKTSAADAHFSCFDSYYKNLVSSYGVDVAFSDLKKRYTEDSYVMSQCHPITHVIGQEAAKSYDKVSEAYLHGDSFCWSGYYHGIMEGFVDRIGVDQLPAKLDTVCADIPGKASYNFDYYNCVHGLGHGVMELLNDDVFKSLTMCDNLKGQWEQLSCYSGVFMENIIADGKNHSSKFLKKSEPLYPCTAVDTKYKDQCYLGQTSYALQVTGNDFPKVFAMCATVESPFRATCNQSMGRDGASQASHDPAWTKKTCAFAPTDDDRLNCIIGAVKEIISYYHAIDQAHAFCDLLDGDDKTTCRSVGDGYYERL